MFRVQAHVFKSEGNDRGLVGKLTFVGSDYKMAKTIADNVQFEDGHHANVDLEMRVNIGRRIAWVDADIHSLENAADRMMQAAQDIREASRFKVAAE